MANYVVSDTNLASVADAIRAKGGTSAPLSFPTEFVSAIQAIPTGGGGDSSKPVRFLDYDGTVVQSYTAEEFAALEAMPENPDHSGDEIPLTAQGWNWSLADAKAYVAKYGALNVGQMYITTDGKTHIKIYIDPDTPANRRVMGVRFKQSVANGVTVDWGDGTEPESFSGTILENHDHTYAQTGWYDITLAVVNGTIRFNGQSSYYSIIGNIESQDSYRCSALKDVRFGEKLSQDAIGDYTFSRSYSLITVTIPDGITSFGQSTFGECSSLASVTIPESVISTGASIFMKCVNLRSVTIPNGITSIAANAFDGCQLLDKIIIPESVTDIGNYAFNNCYSLFDIIIPDGVVSIGSNAFTYSGCVSITMSNNVTSIGERAFYYCVHLTRFTIPDGVTSIANTTFGASGLINVAIPSGVTSIENNAFQNCKGLVSITIPDSVISIGNTAFSGCRNITSVTIPSKVTSIGSNAFQNWVSASEFHLLPTTPPSLGSSAFSNIPSDCIIYVPAASVEDYKAAANWSALASKIQAEPA